MFHIKVENINQNMLLMYAVAISYTVKEEEKLHVWMYMTYKTINFLG